MRLNQVSVTCLTFAFLAACGSREAGIEVKAKLSVVPLTTPTVHDVTIEAARLGIEAIQLVSCAEKLAWLSPVSTAWAHSGHSP